MKKTQRFFVFIFICAVVVLVVLEVLSIITSRLKYSQSNILVALRIQDIDVSESIDELPKWQQEYFSRIDSPLIAVSLDHVFVPSGFLAKDETLCIDRLDVSNMSVDNRLSRDESSSLIGNNNSGEICLYPGKNYVLTSPEKLNVVFYDNYISDYFYPFDQRTMKIKITMNGFKKANSKTTPLDLKPEIDIITSRWWQREVTSIASENSIDLKISLVRPTIYKTLAIFLPLVIILIMLYLPRIKDEGSFWEVVAGLTLGLWGIYEVLVPENYIPFPTILTNVILGLYFLLGIVILFELFIEPTNTFWHKLIFRKPQISHSETTPLPTRLERKTRRKKKDG